MTELNVWIDNGKTKVIYRNTAVVVFDEETIWLNTNGYKTATTKKRMNQGSKQLDLKIRVYQQHGQWYVATPEKTYVFNDENLKIPRQRKEIGE